VTDRDEDRQAIASYARSCRSVSYRSFEGVAMTAVDEKQLFSTGERWNAA